MRPLLPGLVLVCVLGGIGLVGGEWLPSLGGVTLAIGLGVLVGNLWEPGPATAPGIRFAEKSLLDIAVVLLGLQLELGALTQVGASTLLLVAGLVAITITGGLVVGRILGLSPTLGLLLGVGNAVCGTSAIAAAAPVLEENEGEAAVAVGVINALGTVGIVAVPALAVALGFDGQQAAVLIGGTLQAVGHVVAAGFTVSEGVGELATAVKMGRVALLVPVVLTLGLLRARQEQGPSVPSFLIGFVIAVAIAGLGLVPASVVAAGKVATDVLLAVAMAAIGTRIRLTHLATSGTGAFVAGGLVLVAQVGLLALLLS